MVVYDTEIISNSINPEWKMIDIDSVLLCEGDLSKPIRYLNIFLYNSRRSLNLTVICFFFKHN